MTNAILYVFHQKGIRAPLHEGEDAARVFVDSQVRLPVSEALAVSFRWLVPSDAPRGRRRDVSHFYSDSIEGEARVYDSRRGAKAGRQTI